MCEMIFWSRLLLTLAARPALTAEMTKTDSRCAQCLHSKKAHRRSMDEPDTIGCSFNWAYTVEDGWYDGTGEGCDCQAYEAKVKDLAKVKRGRNDRKAGIQKQLDMNREAGFHPRQGDGSDGVFYDRVGTAMLVSESKHKRSFKWAEVEQALQQAEANCQHEPGRPKACVFYATKPGQGRTAKHYMILRVPEWLEIAERLSNV